MTTSSWDKLEIQNKFAHCANLAEIITHIEEEFSQRGEVICEVCVNGVTLSEVEEGKYAQSPVQSVHDLSVRTNTTKELIKGALDSAQAFIPGLTQACVATSELFRASDVARAYRSFTEAIEGCQWLVDTLVHVRNAAKSTSAPVSAVESWLEAERATQRTLHEVSEAFAKPDLVLVADLLEYELPAVLEIWRTAIVSERQRREA